MRTRRSPLTGLAREMRKEPTEAEQRLWYFLAGRRLGGLKFRRQFPIGNYIVDFICVERNLVVELDGGQHTEQVSSDERRTQFLKDSGYRVVRFWNNEVLQETESVLEVILAALTAPHPSPLPASGERE